MISGPLPISIDAPVPPARTIVCVSNDAIDHGDHVARYADDQPAPGKFVLAQVNLAAGANLHRRRQLPAKRFQDPARRILVNAGSGAAALHSPLRDPLLAGA